MAYKDKEKQKEYHKKYQKIHRQQNNIAVRKYRSKNREKIKAYDKEYCARGEVKLQRRAYRMTPRGRYATLISAAKQRQINCDITFEQYCDLIKNQCHYCKGVFRKIEDHEGYFLDRINNDIGYVLENCITCCFICNKIKGDSFTYEETKAAVDAILMYRSKKCHLII